MREDLYFMNLAYEMALEGYRQNEVPVGCVVVDEAGKILAQTTNQKEKSHNPAGHAEILAITKACEKKMNWRLAQCTLYVTLEPCPMCLSACQQTRIGRVVFGAYDSKGGALSLGYALHQDSRLNHQFSVVGGLEHWKCSAILSQFFKERRSVYP